MFRYPLIFWGSRAGTRSYLRSTGAPEAADDPFSLDDPSPVIIFQGFEDSSLNFMIGAWCVREQFLDLKNSLTRDIKDKFDAEGIEIPFPQRVVHINYDYKENSKANIS